MEVNQIWIIDGVKTKHFNCTQLLPDPADIADRDMARVLESSRDLNSGGIPVIFVTDVLLPVDKKEHDPLFDTPKVKEICGLLDKGTFRVVGREDIGDQENVPGGRFFLAINNTETDTPSYKARFVVQGHLDKYKH